MSGLAAHDPIADIEARRDTGTMAKEYVLDGTRITSLSSFYDEIGRVLVPGMWWGENLDAFDDILYGGFGTPEEGFTLRWKHSAASRASLGYDETERWLEETLEGCHPSNRVRVSTRLERARNHQGPTIFDELVEIISRHGVRSEDCEGNVRLILE